MKFLILVLLSMFLISCAKFKGDPGAQGPQGEQGATGPQGPQGIPGITIVKLCPGETTYPTTFVEIAFCVGGVLYGTYSANNGFSTELPPGAYSSNAIGSSCNFTVLNNCAIQW
jgi:hypothetical protein